MANDPNEIGALWLKEGRAGKYLSGKINGVPVVVFKVKDKRNERQPDYRVLRSVKQKPANDGLGESELPADY